MPVPLDFQKGIMSQKILQERFLERRNRLSRSPQPLTSFQISDQQMHDDEGSDSMLGFLRLEEIGNAAKDLLNSLSSGPTTEVQDALNYYPENLEIIPQDSNECMSTRKCSADSILHSIHGTKEDDSFLILNGINGSINGQLPTPNPSDNIFSPSSFVNPSTDASFHKLTHCNEPTDGILRGFSSMESAENQDFSEMLDSSFDPKLWQTPFKVFEQEDEKNNFSNISNPNTYLEDRQIEKQLEDICHPAAPLPTGNHTNSLKHQTEKKKPPTCRQKQKELTPHNFEPCSTICNRFGGIRDFPLDNPQILGENPISHLNNSFDASHDDEKSSNNTRLVSNNLQLNNFLKINESPMELHSPEFHQPFLLLTDSQF